MNSSAKYPVTISGTSTTQLMQITGFGDFMASQLVSGTAQRFKASRVETMSFTAPSASDLGITTAGVPVTFNIRTRSTRLSSELSNDYIIPSRPIVFEIVVSSGDSATTVGAAIVAALTGWDSQFNYSDSGLPYTYSANTGVVTLVMKQYYTFFQSTIIFKVNNVLTPINIVGSKYTLFAGAVAGTGATSATIPVTGTTAGLQIGDTVVIGTALGNALADTGVIVSLVTDTSITIDHSITWVTADNIYQLLSATDPYFDGKYLEENARMSLEDTNGAYVISPDERPIIKGQYSTISWIANDATKGGVDGSYAKHAFLGTTRGEVGGTRQFKYTLYILEGTDMFTTGAGHKVFDITTSVPVPVASYVTTGSAPPIIPTT